MPEDIVQRQLNRSLSLPLLVMYGLGTTVGAGIYVLIGKIAEKAGFYLPVSFLLASFVVAFTALSYAELASRYPLSAGEAVYVQEGFHIRTLSILVGLLVVLAGIVSTATLAKGFAGYLDLFIQLPNWLSIVLVISMLAAIAVWGILESVTVAAIFTLLEIGGLLLIIWVARDSLQESIFLVPQMLPPLKLEIWGGIFLGSFLAFYAYIGFEDMVNVAEEVKNPQRNFPLAVALVLIVTTTLYIAIALIAVTLSSSSELAKSEAPLALLYTKATGEKAVLLGVLSICAIINGALIQIIMASRILYGMSNRRWLPKVLAKVNSVTHTPIIATVTLGIAIIVMALFFPLATLASATSTIVLVIFVLVNISLIRIKLMAPEIAGTYSYPIWVPVLGFISSSVFIVCRILFMDRS